MSADEIRGAEPKFQTFLWSEIQKIREAETQGDFSQALDRATGLIAYLPEDAKEKFRKRATGIREGLNYLATLNGGTDIFTSNVVKHRRLQKAASRLLDGFVNDLTSYLDGRGYMEQRRRKVPTNVPPGFFDQ